jgi:hypothetical protein
MSATEAAQLTQTFRDANLPGTTLGGYFDRAVLDQIVVGVDAQGSDLVEGTIAEKSRPCPPLCSAASTLSR